MTGDTADLLTQLPVWAFGFVLVLARCGCACMLLPGIGEVELPATIRAGFHPVVAASGYSLYYLWVMAGDGRVMMPYMDPAHVWVQQGR